MVEKLHEMNSAARMSADLKYFALYLKEMVDVQNEKVPACGTVNQAQVLLAWLEENKDMPGVALPALQKAQEIYGYVPQEVSKSLWIFSESP